MTGVKPPLLQTIEDDDDDGDTPPCVAALPVGPPAVKRR
jgi:hypothetical protein